MKRAHPKAAREERHVIAGRIDTDFIATQRALGRPDSAIAQMGGWCVSDVDAIPRTGAPVPRPPPAEITSPPKRASDYPEVTEILLHVAEKYCLTVSDILGPSHDPLIVEARHEAMAVAWELNRFTGAGLAEIFRKTPSAVVYGLRRHYERLLGPLRGWNDE